MNTFYPHVEEVLKSYTNQVLEKLLVELKTAIGQQKTSFGCGENEEYVMKRFIGGCLSRDAEIKFNAFTGLLAVMRNQVKVFEVQRFLEYVLEISDHRQHCGGKKSEMESYAIGKILILKTCNQSLVNHPLVINNLSELLKQFPTLQEQILELLGSITSDKKSKTIFSKIVPQSSAGKCLHKFFLSKQKQLNLEMNDLHINELISQLVNEYPRKSTALSYIGRQLLCLNMTPSDYFENVFSLFFAQESLQDLRPLYYYLCLMQTHFNNCDLTISNYSANVNIQMIRIWMEQLRVKNKKIQGTAQETALKVSDPELVFKVLTDCHSNSIYLENVSPKHPLANLYALVDAKAYWTYLHQLVSNQSQISGGDDIAPLTYHSELQFFVRLRFDDFESEEIGQTISTLIRSYKTQKSEQNLNLIWSLLNFVFKTKKSELKIKKRKAAKILSKICLSNLDIQETITALYQEHISQIRNKIKVKNQSNQIETSFLNFWLAVVFYALVYPEQLEACQELELIYVDLSKIISDEVEDKPKKKRKGEKGEVIDAKKPIHVLIDMFISLLTKAPNFLRSAIENLFVSIVPLLDSSDLKQIVEVIQRPDRQYIEEM